MKITKIRGKCVAIRGDDIDTDRIIPARFLKEVTFENMGKYLFYDERYGENGVMKEHPLNDRKFEKVSILLVNKNFGCGSSREHAPQAIMRHGIRAIIGESFAEIFAGNCAMIGIPLLVVSKEEINELMTIAEKNLDASVEIDIANKEINYDNKKLKAKIDDSSRISLIEGYWDSTSMLLKGIDKAREIAGKLPYANNFENYKAL